MDYVTFGAQVLGGVVAAFAAGLALRELWLGALGSVVVGIVGGALAGLILTDYLNLTPAGLADGGVADPAAIAAQVASGAAGGAILMILTGLLESLARR